MVRTFCLLLAPVCLTAQSPDSETLQAILQEVRQLRQDIQGMTFVTQRVQILLYRIRLQNERVKEAAERLDAARIELAQAKRNRSGTDEELNRMKAALASSPDQDMRAQLDKVIPDIERRLEMWTTESRDLGTAEMEASNNLANETATLSELRDRLDRLDRQLEGYATAGQTR